MNRFFDINDDIVLENKQYKVIDFLGKGSTCAAYLTELVDKGNIYHRILKEYNPDNVHVSRDENNSLIINNNEKSNYEKGLALFKEAYDQQCKMCITEQAGNTVPVTINCYECYNTFYAEMEAAQGNNFMEFLNHEMSIKRRLKACRAIAEVVSAYHKKNYLCLDIKPENVFVLDVPNNNVFVKYIDFNSIKKKQNIDDDYKIDSYLSCTPAWAAPEQVISSEHRHILNISLQLNTHGRRS